ncbi:MAG: cobaltochelatase subunit CobN, partial [Acidimicrobiia bacterium]
LFYRAHLIAGNTTFVDDLCAAIRARGANALACWCYSLRPDERGDVPVLSRFVAGRADCVVTTVLAMGGPGEADDSWRVPLLERLDVPVVQAVAATTTRAAWQDSDLGLSPLDVAWSVALPEFDGRIVSVPVSFKEVVDDGDDLGTPVVAYRTIPDRVARVAGLATRLARLRRTANADKRVALVLSAYPTRRARVGNAVGLDTPVSVLALLEALRGAGYRVDRIPESGDALMAELIETFSYEKETLTAAQLSRAMTRVPASDYAAWFAELPEALRRSVEERWGPPPGDVYVDDGDTPNPGDHGDNCICLAGMDLGGVLVTVQPPRGFGEDPIAVYHSPGLPPTHHYLAFYRWLDQGWGAHAVVHVGKHGNLEWLPGKGVGLSAACGPDAALGDLPLVYPFVVNDPGEGTQAKR